MQEVELHEQKLMSQQAGPSSRSLRNKRVVDLAFKDISYIVKNGDQQRVILNKLSGFCPGGEVTAIMGSSGAGKTSLLNIIAARVASGGNVSLTGQLLANGQNYDAERFSMFASYVMQNDVLFETLTPRESFQFVADLKYSDPELKSRRVLDTIKTMKLERCQDAMIGGISMKGISGGERKRTSIGFELVTNPSAIILDEPTSGLDSFTAFQIIYELKQLAVNQERTIVFTIHQPSSDIFLLFDRIMLLVQGQFIYQGKRDQIVEYFRSFGFSCPDKCNPMDYFIQIMHTQSKINVQNFPIYFQNYEQKQAKAVLLEIDSSSTQEIIFKKVETTTIYQISKITNRAIKSFCRDRSFMINRAGMAVFMGLLCGGSFWNVGDNNGSFQTLSNVSGALFLLCMNLVMGSVMPVILQFSVERDVFLREENSKLYSTFSYFVGKSTVEIPFIFITPIVQELILYWMVGLNAEEGGYVVTHLFIAVLMSLCGNSIGLMAGCAFKDVKVATGIVPMVLMPLIIFSGFFANSKYFYVWIGWLQYLSPVKYAFEALSINEYQGRHYDMDPQQLYGFETGLWESVGILIAFFFFFRIMAFLFLYFMRSKLQ